jgi:two-component system, cell cycle response regulator DivK
MTHDGPMDTGRMSILVVEDNPLNAKLTRLVLQQEGCHVETAADATQALDVLSRFTPRVILMDLQLPGMDGFELTRRLKRDPALDGVIIIALTAYAMKGDEDRAAAAGCDGYIAKPIETRNLMAQIMACVSRHPSSADAAAAPAAGDRHPGPSDQNGD